MASVVRILHILDQPGSRGPVAGALQSLGIVQAHAPGELPALRGAHERIDCIVIEHAGSSCSAPEMLRQIAARGPHAPVVVVSAARDEELAVECIKAGADDYIPAARAGEQRLRQAVESALARPQPHGPDAGMGILLQQFMERSPMAAYMKDEQGHYIYANQALATAFGIRPSEWIGRTPAQVWPTPLGQRIESADRSVMLSARPAETVETYPHPDGEHTWLVYRYPLTDARGRRVLAAMGVDVTERQRYQERLREAEQRYRSLFEQSQFGVYIVDPDDGTIIEFNQVAHRQLGYDREEFARLKIAQLDAMLSIDQIRERIDRVLRDGSDEFETRLRARSGELRDVLVNIRSISVGGRVVLHSVVQDITERNRLREQLVHSQKMEAIGRLAGGVAHDFNNLLAVICGYSESMSRRLAPDDPLRLHALEIQKAAERGGALTRQLLAFSRRQIVRPQMLNLNRVLESLLDMLRRLMPEEVEVVLAAEPSLPGIRADQGQMEQVLVNLAINARDAMPAGGRLTIQTRLRAVAPADAPAAGVEAGAYAELSVIDTGHGMDAATAARVFEPFFTTKDGKGTGLGLSIVYGIVQQSGGAISVSSHPGQGSAFTILLPAATDAPG